MVRTRETENKKRKTTKSYKKYGKKFKKVEYDSGSSGEGGDADNESDADCNNELESTLKHQTENETKPNNADFANVVSKILHKSIPNQKNVILSESREKRKQKLQKETAGDLEKTPIVEDKLLSRKNVKKKQQWRRMGNVKPSVLDKESERNFQRIATRGVVQLFNAVEKQQKMVSKKLNQVQSSVRKKDNVMKSFTTGSFLDLLKGKNVSISSDPAELEIGQNKRVEKQNKWSVLREDFMIGGKMKDWDKEDEEKPNLGVNEDIDISDSE